MSAVVLLVELKMEEGRQGDFIARAQRHRELVLANEPACQRFDIVAPDGADDVVHLYEVYDDQEAVDHHMQTDYMAAYRADTASMVADRKIVTAALANG